MNTAIYIRVSTSEQSYSNQKPAIEAFAASRDLTIVAEYAEAESAWKSGHQKELARLIKDCKAGKFDVVLVWSLDRLTRKGPGEILALVKRFREYNVRLLSIQESWTEAPGELGDLLFAIIGWVAEMESKRRSERTKAGLARKKAGGDKIGRKPGSKDRKKRNGEGYKLRQARDRLARAEERL